MFADNEQFNEGEWPEETGDFWAYDGNTSVWTGYYSTNPQIKRQISEFSDFVQSAT